jgi:hypothetical protein
MRRNFYLMACAVTVLTVVLGNAQWPVLRQPVERVVDAVNAAKPNTYCEVEIPKVYR